MIADAPPNTVDRRNIGCALIGIMPMIATTDFGTIDRAHRGRSGRWQNPRPGSDNDVVPGLPDLDVARVRRWCERRVPEHARGQVRMECEVAPRHLTIVERRAPWRDQFGPEWSRLPIARLSYSQSTKQWSLYWRDRNSKFHRYDNTQPTADVRPLLDEIDNDPTHIFWG